MNYNEALAYINDKDKYGSRLGLDSIGTLLGYLENPHKNLKCIHVAGTNGKGSTSAYIAQMLRTAGYRVGLYTSPYLESFTERIQINNLDIPKEDLAKITELVKMASDKMVENGIEHPTTFEIVTAIAFVYFREQDVDYVVLEVGLGGRYDSTNIIQTSLASVITTIDYDHTEILGNTLSEIAYQKAGIIKENGLVILYPQNSEAEVRILQVAEEKNARVVKVPMDGIDITSQTYLESVFNFKINQFDFENIKISMIGKYQIYNAVTAITTIIELEKLGVLNISEKELKEGLLKTKWKGRLEVIKKNPIFLIDGAHNLQGITQLVEAIKLFPYKRLILGVAVLKDKDFSHMIEKISLLADEVVATEVNMPRKLDANILANEVSKHNRNVHIEKDIKRAILKTFELSNSEDMIVFCGSLYLIGEVRTIINLL
ncbi:MAG: folylpolyglutamate synthase/dihydrofolate synthase family protein [Gudongella sp.]|nr:folylpolyglutamate synthase/dihydrofolate synthase family protein [Gudongella sp.]